jgi:hypothetical protein
MKPSKPAQDNTGLPIMGSGNGWLKDAPERTRQIYVLKNLKNRSSNYNLTRILRP